MHSVIGLLGIVIYLAALAIVALVLYWVIRLAVRHAIADARKAGGTGPGTGTMF